MTTADIIAATPHLAQELETYYRYRGELLRTDRGKYVLIKGNAVVAIFANEAKAYDQGYQRFKLSPFLVRQIMEGEQVYSIGGSASQMLLEDEVCAASGG